jgi:hypothetical protein
MRLEDQGRAIGSHAILSLPLSCEIRVGMPLWPLARSRSGGSSSCSTESANVIGATNFIVDLHSNAANLGQRFECAIAVLKMK